MLKQSIIAAALALAAAAPANAASALPLSFGSLAGGSATHVFALPLAGSSGSSGGLATTLRSLPATLVAATPLTKSSELLPSTALGLKSTKITKPSLKGKGTKLKLDGGQNLVSQFTGTLASLPNTGVMLLTTSSGSVISFPRTGAAVLRSTLR